MKKKNYKKPIMIPEAESKMYEMRYKIVKKLGYLVVNADDWWEALTPAQKAEVNGIVTKLMVEKAKRDMMQGFFKH